MVALSVGWGMENLNYKLIMWVKQSNVEVVQFCAMLCDFQWHVLHVPDRGEDDRSYVLLAFFKTGVMKAIERYHFNSSL